MDCDGDGSKRVRKRKKALYSQISKQMEFYFSDANLQKDRFLNERLGQSSDGYIELSLFLSFNRIRKLTTSTKDIANALRKSTILQLDEDRLRVKRTTAVEKPQNIDDRTVYVECLPAYADHEWVRRVFSVCGNIAYVSIPKYRSTGDPKGFAFVEFDTEDAAHKACELLNNPPASLEDKPGKFPKWNKTLSQLQMQIKKTSTQGQEPEENVKTNTQHVIDRDNKPGKQNRKRHRTISDCSVASVDETDSKRLQMDGSEITPNVSSSDPADVSNISEKSEGDNPNESLRLEGDVKSEAGDSRKRKRKRRKSDKKVKAEDEKEAVTVNSSTVPDDKQRRKRKRLSAETIEPLSKKSKDSSVELIKGDTESKAEKGAVTHKRKKQKRTKKRDSELPELRVISKCEWLALKQEYISVQKANMADLKKTLKQCKEQMNNITQGSAVSVSSKRETPQDATAMETKSERTPEFMANVIVKVHASQPLVRKQLKALLPSEINVAYIDVQDGISNDGYIRCKDAESAEKLVKVEESANTFTLITGSEEESYWNKLKADREAKLSSTKRGKKRGMQKLVERAERLQSEVVQRKHVVFADE